MDVFGIYVLAGLKKQVDSSGIILINTNTNTTNNTQTNINTTDVTLWFPLTFFSMDVEDIKDSIPRSNLCLCCCTSQQMDLFHFSLFTHLTRLLTLLFPASLI